MDSMKKSNKVLDEVTVKNEPICDRISISHNITSMKVKEEPIDNEIQTSKSLIEVKAEEKFSGTEEFANKASIAFLNEEPTNQSTTSKSQMNQHKSK